jgi:hypothetical protein
MTGAARRLAAAVLLAALGACAEPAASPTVEPVTPAGGAAVLPGGQAFVPDGIGGVTPWIQISSLPGDFDAGTAYATSADLADAFGGEINASFAGSPQLPDLTLDVADESEDGALLIISETGIGDDSVAGNQYALVVRREDDGWRLRELWRRGLCSRGVTGERCL